MWKRLPVLTICHSLVRLFALNVVSAVAGYLCTIKTVIDVELIHVVRHILFFKHTINVHLKMTSLHYLLTH